MVSSDLSIIILFLNDSLYLEDLYKKSLINTTSGNQRVQIIVCDGGSRQEEVETAKKLCQQAGWSFYPTPNPEEGLAFLLQSAIQKYESQKVLFLPCDCSIDETHIDEILTLSSPWNWGGFPKKYSSSSLFYPVYLFLLNKIIAPRGRLVWTNALFAKRETLLEIQWPEGSFLVDWFLSKELRKIGPHFLGQSLVTVSDRKYQAQGVLKQIFINGFIVFLLFLGVRNKKFLKNLYR